MYFLMQYSETKAKSQQKAHSKMSDLELDYQGLENGLKIIYDFDPSAFILGDAHHAHCINHQHALFKRFMNERSLTIDMWDGDSMMHFGQCRIPLYLLLRQGEPNKVIDL